MDNENDFTPMNDNQENVTGEGQFEQGNDGGQSYQTYGEPESKGMAIGSMVCGILSLVLCCIPYLPYLLAIVGMVLGIMVLVGKKPGKGMAIAGIVCSAICLVLAIIGIIAIAVFSTNVDYQSLLNEIQNYQN